MVFLSQVTAVVRVELVKFLEQFICVPFMVVDLVDEVCLLFEERGNVCME